MHESSIWTKAYFSVRFWKRSVKRSLTSPKHLENRVSYTVRYTTHRDKEATQERLPRALRLKSKSNMRHIARQLNIPYERHHGMAWTETLMLCKKKLLFRTSPS
ncbi:hypothetical protein V3C99_002778 [Haemonchus contortus]